MTQSMYTRSCKYWVLPSGIVLPLQLQPNNDFKLQLISTSVWYWTTPPVVATRQWFELQSIYTVSCKYWVLLPDIVLPLQLQPNNDFKLQLMSTSVWYWTTPSVAATRQWFELQSIYTLSCKYWVLPPDIVLPLQLQPNNGFKLQLMSTSVWYWTTPSVAATRQWFELQSIYTLSCKY
jgi:hypothetical protein